jgi:hypothetical protein
VALAAIKGDRTLTFRKADQLQWRAMLENRCGPIFIEYRLGEQRHNLPASQTIAGRSESTDGHS